MKYRLLSPLVGTLKQLSRLSLSNPTAIPAQQAVRRCRIPICRIAVFLLATLLSAHATEFYVTPTGSSAGTGTAASPWDLQTALNQPSAVKPGDTIWVRAGVHRVNNFPTQFKSVLAGTAAQPITVRAWPGERATIDGNIQLLTGGWVNYWGLEIMDSLPNRTSTQTGPWPTTWWETMSNGQQTDYCVSGVDLRVPNVKFINCVIHDNVGGGFGVDILADGSEVYGSLSYYNGWQGADRGHGHGLYLQNAGPASTKITDSMFFENYALGIQSTGAGPSPVADDVDIEGNAMFMNGILSTQHQQNFLVGPFQGVSQNPIVVSNCVYDINGSGSDTFMGYDGGMANANIAGNYFGTSVQFGPQSGMTLAGNTFCAGTIAVTQSAYPNNTYLTVPPATGTKIMVRPNRYEAGRANIIIYNWGQASTVNVDISTIGLNVGDQYELHNVQDFYADIITGTYSGGTITIPMTGHTVAAPTSHTAPPSTFPKFGAFVIMRKGTGTPPASNLPTITGFAAQTINVSTSAGPLTFTVGSSQVAATSLTVTVSSSNPTLLPVANIVLGGSGANRTVTITPVAGQTGSATITLAVSDGTNSASTSFALTVAQPAPVNTAPTLTQIPDTTISVNTSTGPLPITVGDAQTPAANLVMSEFSSGPTLIPDANIVFGGSGASRTVTLTPIANQTGTAIITIGVSDGSLKSIISFAVIVTGTTPPVNTAPTITSVAGPTITAGSTIAPLTFTVGDAQTAAGSLTVTATSSNPTLVPAGNCTLGGSGTSRTVTVTPVAGQTGSATITLTVSDGALTSSTSFAVTVNAAPNTPPALTTIAAQTINANASTGPLSFTVGDAETAAASLTVSASSSNPTLVPTGNIVLGGSGASRTVTVTPAANQAGTATIGISVSDGVNVTAHGFSLTVNAVTPPATNSNVLAISAIAEQVIEGNTATAPVPFTVADNGSATSSLTLTGSSSNPALVPNGNIVFAGSGTSRTVTVTPLTNQAGLATITITAAEGSATAVTSFALAVNPVVASNQLVYLTLEANAATVVAPMVVAPDVKATDGDYVSSPTASQGSVTFSVDIPVAGTYVIWARVLATGSTSESFLVAVDGGATDIYDAAMYTASPWWQWSVVNGRNNIAPLTLNPRTFVLTSGIHTVAFKTRDANVKLDRILITNDQKIAITEKQ